MNTLLSGPNGRFRLGPTALRIGRSPENQLVLNDSEVSSFHAEIFPQGQDYVIVDLASRNGTFINGERLQARTPRQLDIGDNIRFGETTFCYMADVPSYQVAGLADTAAPPEVRRFQPQPPTQRSAPPSKREASNNKNSGDGTPGWIKIAGGLASLAAVFTAIWGVYTFLHSNSPPPTPTNPTQTAVPTASIPQLHGSYVGPYTNTTTGLQFTMTMSSLTEASDGSFTSVGNDGVCPVTFAGVVKSDNSISFTVTEAVGTTSSGVACGSVGTFSGQVFSDGHLAGRWQGSVNGAGGTWSLN